MVTNKIWGLPGWVQRDLPVTDRNGASSSPDVPAGTGGTKVRSKVRVTKQLGCVCGQVHVA